RCVFFLSRRRRHRRLVSDWSSDVCSSDLDMKQPNRLLKVATIASSVLLLSGFVSYRAGAFHWLMRSSAPPADAVGSATQAPGTQIGRASCRERGKSSGVAV